MDKVIEAARNEISELRKNIQVWKRGNHAMDVRTCTSPRIERMEARIKYLQNKIELEGKYPGLYLN